MFTISSWLLIANSVSVYGQTNVKTSAFIVIEPNPVQVISPETAPAQVSQKNLSILVSIRIEPVPPTPNVVFHNLTVTYINADGTTTILSRLDTNPDGSQIFTLAKPERPGNYTYAVSFPGEAFVNGTLYYLPSENQTVLVAFPPPPPSWSTVGSWTQKASMPAARGNLGVSVVNDKIYAIGGETQRGQRIYTGGFVSPPTGGVVGTNEEYDPASNIWTTKAPMPTPRANFAIATYQNKIYCIGGRTTLDNINSGLTGVNEVYDPATNTWMTRAPMPTPRSWVQANVVDGKIFLIGGYPNETLNEVYDPATNTWTTKASMPLGPGYPHFYASAVLDGKIYVVSGSLQIYDPKADKWSMGASPPSSLGGSAAAGSTIGALAPKRIYVIGVPSDYEPSNHIYNPENDSWTFGADMPTLRENFAVAVVNDTFYVIGGHTFDVAVIQTYAPSKVNEQYVPIGYGTSDPNYQPPTPSPSPSPSPTSNPTSTPVLSPSQSPTSSPTTCSASPSPSQQPTQSPEPQPTTSPVELIYIAAAIAFIAIIIAIALILKRRT